MNKIRDLVRVFVRGGIISPGDLLKIIKVAEKLGTDYVHFGSRQDILFPIKDENKKMLEKTFESIHTHYEINTFQFQNIASSYVALDVLPSKKWLTSDRYINIINSFDFRPKLRINVVDPSQSLVPLFTGHINFVASNIENFWYVYLRFGDIQGIPWCLPVLAYSDDLPNLSRAIEDLDHSHFRDYQSLYSALDKAIHFTSHPVTEELVQPKVNFPYYEGINRLQDGKYWLGLYWRNNRFKTTILKAICERCLSTEVGKISLTPWKSFLVKGIFEKDLVGWEKLIGKLGMNLRHSSLELNWHLPALDEEALELKIYLVRTLDQQDINTSGLTFTINTSPDMIPFTSVVIEKNPVEGPGPETYNIQYSKDFNPNLTEYRPYAERVTKEVLAPLLIDLSVEYFESLDEEVVNTPDNITLKSAPIKKLYQCQSCLTVYDETLGDEQSGVSLETPFANLPESYSCPLCGGPKDQYFLIQ
ncbi:MAG: rubredoxin [Cyclobacteriaceae bacterium]|nr:rubredoxin [Cyclobacteriaceae bacterium HetDA_MAG_MS6]